MDLHEASQRLQITHRRYLDWRELAAALREAPAGEPLPAWLAAECRRLDAEAPVEDHAALAPYLEQQTTQIKRRLIAARVDNWQAQGRMLRYSLVVVENRVGAIRDELQRLGEPIDARMHALNQRLEAQIATLRGTIENWEAARELSQICSLDDLGGFILDPYHDADKEHLERIVARAREAELPPSQACIRLVWDGVTGEVRRAEIVPDAGAKAA